jgi:hypothetical protein
VVTLMTSRRWFDVTELTEVVETLSGQSQQT